VLEAAQTGDYEELRPLVPEQLEYTFGSPVEGGAISFWQQLEDESGASPIGILADLLALPYTLYRGIYVWPFAFDRDPRRLTGDELEQLSTFATQREIEGWRQFGGYIGYRAGIERDGDWVFYVAGD
jgi:hypothetical protein